MFAKNGTLVICVLGLFLLAGMIITKGKNPLKTQQQEGFRKHFRIIGYKTSMGVVCISFLLIANIMDYLQMNVL